MTSQLAQAVTVIVEVVRVVMMVVFPASVFVVVAGQTVVVVYVVMVVVSGYQRASRALAKAVVAKANITNAVLILCDGEYSWEEYRANVYLTGLENEGIK